MNCSEINLLIVERPLTVSAVADTGGNVKLNREKCSYMYITEAGNADLMVRTSGGSLVAACQWTLKHKRSSANALGDIDRREPTHYVAEWLLDGMTSSVAS